LRNRSESFWVVRRVRVAANSFRPASAIDVERRQTLTTASLIRPPSESVAEAAAKEVREYLVHGAPVGEHLADQLLIPMALGGVSAFVTSAPTAHFTSNAHVIATFTGRHISAQRQDGQYRVAATEPG
jgi:RNA 3'-terminal phosphate cyclase